MSDPANLPRVVSMLPAATEIIAALGMVDALVGVSHECDFPPEVQDKPRITQCDIHGNELPSDQIDAWVTSQLATAGTLYTMDEPMLRRLAPDVIVTQRLCDVCAVGWETVNAFAATLPGPPVVVNLEPQTLAEVFGDIRRVGAALGVSERAETVVAALEARIDVVRTRVDGAPRRRCVLLEWITPPYRSGHWDPELVEIAGGHDPVGRAGEDAAAVPWDAIRDAAPEVLVVACCGFDVARTRRDLPALRAYPGFDTLPAVRNRDVWLVDGSAFFSRPGPRLVDSLEILARLVHPERYDDTPLPPGVERM
ncbi:MAG TPA: cobalamin-binding protein [Candidatus Binatia bacterium]|nr:cobalamin-binding protein [Candidatus Binatia bacterium]